MGNRDMQAAFIAGHIIASTKGERNRKRVISSTLADSDEHIVRRNCYVYYLTLSSHNRVEVCKQFYVTIYLLAKKTVDNVAKTAVAGIAKPRSRKKPSNNKIYSINNYIHEHISSFPAVESHNCQATSSKKL